MAVPGSSGPRVTVDGKFFRLGDKKFYVKGLSYGPFAPNAAGQPFPSPDQSAADFTRIRQLGANLIRVYHTPARWFLDLAAEHQLKILVDVPWNKHLCFLESLAERENARDAVRRAVYAGARHPAIFAYSVANEIPPDVVRWSGTRPVANFLDHLIAEAKRIDNQALVTFGNYPPTEFLRPQNADFLTFNVYLHHLHPFKKYLARLQMLADSKPLLLGEFGIDTLREGESRQREILSWQIEHAFRGGLAGAILFSFTDDWYREGRLVRDWAMGITDPDRKPKPAFGAVRDQFTAAPHFPLPRYPKISVVVASYNADRTLKACLQSLQHLNYPDYEVILVDDGSTDTTPQIAFLYPTVKYLRHTRNLGLSVARNTGISAASGEIIAFTDADCRADPDWLYYLAAEFLHSDFAAVGGPNLMPPEDSDVAAAVMASPGGPAHVMLNDRQAEHIPGCNMAFYRWALDEIGGFDPLFRAAGDDVDVCWRLEQAGYKIGFSPPAFVWHYRRSTVPAYLKQQRGYGEAEALLVRKHPEYFNSLGGSVWRGRIYASAKLGLRLGPSIIYRGLFGSAGFQALYVADPSPTLMLATTLEYHVLVNLPLWLLAALFAPALPIALTSTLISLSLCALAGAQAELPPAKKHWWSRPLVALLYLLQPIVRGWARYQGRLILRPAPAGPPKNLDSLALRDSPARLDQVQYWAEGRIDRLAFVRDILRRLDAQAWPNKADIGWSEFDVEILASRWASVQLVTAAEDHPFGRQMLRCRLRGRWSLPSKLAFSLLAASLALLLGIAGGTPVALWLLLALLPLFAWFLQRQVRDLQSVLVVFLDQVAADWHLTRVRDSAPEPLSPPSAANPPFDHPTPPLPADQPSHPQPPS